MSNQNYHLTENHQRLIRTFLAQAGESAINKKFNLVRHGHRKYARLNDIEIAVNLSDQEMTALARLGYLQIYTNPPAVIFTQKVLTETEEDKRHTEPTISEKLSPNIQVVQMDIIQVYAWLIASLLAGIFSLFLLWFTVQQVISSNISESVFAGIMTTISGLLSGVFFRNYDKANDHLKHLRSLPDNSNKKDEK